MSMGCRGLGIATIAAASLFVFSAFEPAYAASAGLSAMKGRSSFTESAAPIQERVLLHHRRRVQSFYCYPRNYWWFYRPYTTALDGHPRCMPYFHYLGPYDRRGVGPDRYVK